MGATAESDPEAPPPRLETKSRRASRHPTAAPPFDRHTFQRNLRLLRAWQTRAEALARAHDRTSQMYRALNIAINTMSLTASAAASGMSLFPVAGGDGEWKHFAVAAVNSLSTVCIGVLAITKLDTLDARHNSAATSYEKIARDIAVQVNMAGSREALFASLSECLRHIQSEIDYVEVVTPPLPSFLEPPKPPAPD